MSCINSKWNSNSTQEIILQDVSKDPVILFWKQKYVLVLVSFQKLNTFKKIIMCVYKHFYDGCDSTFPY